MYEKYERAMKMSLNCEEKGKIKEVLDILCIHSTVSDTIHYRINFIRQTVWMTTSYAVNSKSYI